MDKVAYQRMFVTVVMQWTGCAAQVFCCVCSMCCLDLFHSGLLLTHLFSLCPGHVLNITFWGGKHKLFLGKNKKLCGVVSVRNCGKYLYKIGKREKTKGEIMRKKFGNGKFLFSFGNVQNEIGGKILFNNNFCERSVGRALIIHWQGHKKTPSDA